MRLCQILYPVVASIKIHLCFDKVGARVADSRRHLADSCRNSGIAVLVCRSWQAKWVAVFDVCNMASKANKYGH